MSSQWLRCLTKIADYPAPVRILLFLSGLVLLWLPIAVLIALLIPDANTVTILTMSLLFIGFLVALPVWGRWVHQSPVFRTYGLRMTRSMAIDWLMGFSWGGLALLLLLLLQGVWGWLVWQPVPASLGRVIGEGLLSAAGIGFAEELVFRGWVLEELERDYRPAVSLWGSSIVFASLHFLKPLAEMQRTFPQFPGLVLLGLTLVWAKRSTQGRLGLPMGLHSGLVFGYYVVNIGGLVVYSRQVPAWITGIDGNPLAGVMGLLFLGAIGGMVRWRSHHQ